MSDFVTPWTATCQASLSITNFQSLLKLLSIELVMPSNHLILCRPLLPLPSLSQHQGPFQWVSSLHQVAKVLEFPMSAFCAPLRLRLYGFSYQSWAYKCRQLVRRWWLFIGIKMLTWIWEQENIFKWMVLNGLIHQATPLLSKESERLLPLFLKIKEWSKNRGNRGLHLFHLPPLRSF